MKTAGLLCVVLLMCCVCTAAGEDSPPYDGHESRFELADPNYTRLLLAPTARTLEQGRGYYCNREVLMHGLAYGVTDRLTVEVGGAAFPTGWPPYAVGYCGAKIGIAEGERHALSAGGLYFDGDAGRFGVGFLMWTGGPVDLNFTLGLGGGGWSLHDYSFGGWLPIGFAGVNWRFAKNFAVVGEIWSSPMWFDGLRYSPGITAVRWFGRRWALDAGVVTSSAMWSGDVSAFPVVELSYNF